MIGLLLHAMTRCMYRKDRPRAKPREAWEQLRELDELLQDLRAELLRRAAPMLLLQKIHSFAGIILAGFTGSFRGPRIYCTGTVTFSIANPLAGKPCSI